MTRHHDVATSPLLASDIPLLAHTAGEVGDPQIRHRGTIGGSVAHGDAASDLPATLLALDAVFVIRGPAGTRSVPAAEFFKGIFETAIEPGELLTEIQVPKPARPSAWSFQKFTKRKIDWAIVGVAVQGSSVALINMGLTPLRASAVESALASGASIADAAALRRRGHLGRFRHPREQGLPRAPRPRPGQARSRGGGRAPVAHSVPPSAAAAAAASPGRQRPRPRRVPDTVVRPCVTRRLHPADNGSVRLRSVLARPFRYPVRWLAFLAGGVPAVLVFPGPSLSYLAWFALVPGMVLFTRAATTKEAVARGWWFGAGYLIAILQWMTPEIGPGVVLIGAVFGCMWSPFAIAVNRLLRPPASAPGALAALIVVPSCWLIPEWIRSYQGLGGPWGLYGASQWQHPAVLALAAIGGTWLVSVALLLANTGLLLVAGRAPPGPADRHAPAPTAGTAATAARPPHRARRARRRRGRGRRRIGSARVRPDRPVPRRPHGDDRPRPAGRRAEPHPAGRRLRGADQASSAPPGRSRPITPT